MKKLFHIDLLEYNFLIKKLVISGWIIVDKTTDYKLQIKNEYVNKYIELKKVRNDVKEYYKNDILETNEAFSFNLEIDLNIEKLEEQKEISFILIENEKIILTEKIKLDKDIIVKNKTINFNIDETTKNDKNILIKGWAYSRANEEVKIITNIKNSEITRINRLDVFRAHKDCKNGEKIGFEIKIPRKIKKVVLKFEDKYSVKETEIKAKDIKNLESKGYNFISLINYSNLKKGTKYLIKNGPKGFLKKIKTSMDNKKIKENFEIDYDEWFKKQRLNNEERKKQKGYKFDYNPKISIVTPTFNTPKNFLIEMIESVRNQTYSNWELCLADGASEKKETLQVLKEYEKKDSRIKVIYLNKNLKISGNTNEAIKISTGDYIGLFDHDDLLTEDALFEVVKAINKEKAEFIYTDEDKINEDGTLHFDPYFKPDFSIHMLRSNNYICHFTVFKKTLLDKVGLFRSEYDGAQDYDMILRLIEQTKKIVHIPKILYHWRVHKNSTAGSSTSKSYTSDMGKKAIISHLGRLGIKGKVNEDFAPNFYKVEYELQNSPLVSIIISNKDHKEDLKKCLDSLKRTTYKNYEIIVVENNSETKEIFDYYNDISKEKNIKVIKWNEKGFNYSAINNFGVKNSKGEFIVLLNNDTELITENWLEELVSVCQQKNVGIVGTKLYFPDNTIQHAGVYIGIGGVAGHVFSGYSRNDFGPFGRLKMRQNLSAVTAAALIIRKNVFEEVNGLEENQFKVAFNDVDLCMKVIKAGYEIVWSPYVELYHYESKSRGYEDTPEKKERFSREIKSFEEKWGLWLEDPYYNRNFDLTQIFPILKKLIKNKE